MTQIEWLESMHTLHGSIEILYVVSGYQIKRTYYDCDFGEPITANTLSECIDLAIKDEWEPLTNDFMDNHYKKPRG